MTPAVLAAPAELDEVDVAYLSLQNGRPDLSVLDFPLVSTREDDILEHELEPAAGDALPVDFLYDHPERGEEQRRIVPIEIRESTRGAQLVLGYDQDRDGALRHFRVDRIRAARLEG